MCRTALESSPEGRVPREQLCSRHPDDDVYCHTPSSEPPVSSSIGHTERSRKSAANWLPLHECICAISAIRGYYFSFMLFETDPVCKMQVMPETAAAKYDYEGRTYYFCATRCMERFRANPQQFLTPLPISEIRNPKSETSSSIPYTCPMHPEVHQLGPGSCRNAAWRLNQKWHRKTTKRTRN